MINAHTYTHNYVYINKCIYISCTIISNFAMIEPLARRWHLSRRQPSYVFLWTLSSMVFCVRGTQTQTGTWTWTKRETWTSEHRNIFIRRERMKIRVTEVSRDNTVYTLALTNYHMFSTQAHTPHRHPSPLSSTVPLPSIISNRVGECFCSSSSPSFSPAPPNSQLPPFQRQLTEYLY